VIRLFVFDLLPCHKDATIGRYNITNCRVVVSDSRRNQVSKEITSESEVFFYHVFFALS